jgi:methionine aminopeptidase
MLHRNCIALLQPPLAEGDTVKVELGCHVDGYVAVVAHTIKVCAPLTVQRYASLTLPFLCVRNCCVTYLQQLSHTTAAA